MSAHADRIRLRGSTGDVELIAGDAHPNFWWVFTDAGGGTLAVSDATGNNRVPTITGGTFATGPVVPGV